MPISVSQATVILAKRDASIKLLYQLLEHARVARVNASDDRLAYHIWTHRILDIKRLLEDYEAYGIN